MNSFQGSIACFILKAFAGFLSMLPFSTTLWVGRRLGDFVCLMGSKNRRKARNNIKIAFGPAKSCREREAMLKKFYRFYGQNLVELAQLPRIARAGFERFVDVDGREHVDAAMKKGKGLIFLSMHSGNWELSNLVGSMSGYPYNMVANYFKNINQVADYLDSLRQSAGCRIINPGIGGREIIKRLKNNEIVTLVADQGGEEGVLVPFFGREASMSTGAVRLALKYGAAICLVDIHRQASGRHQLVARPFDPVDTGDIEKDVRSNMQTIARWFQKEIERHPEEYIWSYGTWKYSAVRHCVVLDDGRTGHLRQSEAVLAHLKTALEGCSRVPTDQMLGVDFRSRGHAFLLEVLTMARLPFLPQDIRMLRPFVTRDCFERLSSVKADFVVSCGAKNAAVNYWMAKENGARNVAILRPGMLSKDLFDLVILPEHDLHAQAPHPRVLLTKAAPNLIDEHYLEENKKRLLNRFSHLKSDLSPKIGVLIGGDAKGVVMTEPQMKRIFHQLKDVAASYGATILLTTSRRTPPDIDRLVDREFAGKDPAALLVIASRGNTPEAVGGILALSDILLVSGESVSMVSEAASSGKTTVVFSVGEEKDRSAGSKYVHFIEALGRAGHIIYTETQAVAQALDSALKGKVKPRPLDDRGKIMGAMRKLAA